MDETSLEQCLDQGLSLAEVGRRFGLHESTVGYWVKKHGLRAVNQETAAARGGLARAQLEVLIEEELRLRRLPSQSDVERRLFVIG